MTYNVKLTGGGLIATPLRKAQDLVNCTSKKNAQVLAVRVQRLVRFQFTEYRFIFIACPI
jgi:hypothetical protein